MTERLSQLSSGVGASASDLAESTAAASEGQQLYESLLQSIDCIIWECDAATFRFTFVSRQAERILGYPVEQWLGETGFWANHLHPDDRPWAVAYCADATQQRRDHRLEYRMIAADGRAVWLSDLVKVHVTDEGQTRLRGVMMDITERKLAEEALEANEALLREFIRHTPAAIAMFDTEMRYLQTSDRWLTDYHLEGQNIIGKSHYEVFPDLPGRWKAVHARALRGAVEKCDEDLNRHADGGLEWIQWEAIPWRKAGGEIGGLILFTQVITERKQAEEKLRWSEERLRLILDSAAEGIFGVDLEGRCTFCNAASLRLLGYDQPADLLGRDMHALIAGKRADGTPYPIEECPAVQSLRSARGNFSKDDVFWRKDGTCFPVEYWSYPMFRAGEHIGAVLTFLDLSERRRAEEQNRKLIHALGERVKELTALHYTARLLQDEEKSVPELLQEIVSLLPPAWQYPEVTAAHISFGEMDFKTPNFSPTQWSQVAQFTVGSLQGAVEVLYLEERPAEDIGPFLLEERNLLNSVAEMIHSALNRRFVQEALRASEERFAKAFQASPEPISIYRHRDGTLQEVNDRWTAIYGFTRAEAIGRTSVEMKLLSREVRRRIKDLLERQGFIRDLEVDLQTKGGEIRRVSLAAEHIVIDHEPCDIFLHHDITERKQAEEELRASREQLRALWGSLRRAKEEEGIRIARELHDELGAALTSLKWSLTGLDKVFTEDVKGGGPGGTARAKIAEMVGLVDSTVNTVRRISSELRPGVLDDLGLVSAIEWHAQQFQVNTGILCRFDSQIEHVDLSRGQATTVFRIFQEAMTNILRHAQATQVNVLIEIEEDEFVLEVSDNGRGITESEKLGMRSLGLLGMRERAHSIGGRVEINGLAGRGTTVIVRVPYQVESTS